ncbi:MAG: multiple resistance and pH regulation protein F, partial [Deltaproteobacteria bacterium]|nr:multiple resistance and pH regulation protein F [Deltaproteobacteria bacterium]
MNALLLGIAAFLLANLAAGLGRVMRGPTAADRMLAAQLFATTAVAIVLLLGEAQGEPGMRDVAPVFALLAAMASVAF